MTTINWTASATQFQSVRRWHKLIDMSTTGPDATTDRELMLAYGQGDQAAFTQLYERHKGPLYRYFQRQCGRNDQVDELFQETWSRIIKARERYQPSAKFTTWMYHIAHNILMDYGRKLTRQPFLVAIESHDVSEDSKAVTPPANDPSPEQSTDNAYLRQRLLSALAALPADQREAFLLKEEAGLTLQEIADVMDVGRETIKSRLRYALKKLRSALSDERQGET